METMVEDGFPRIVYEALVSGLEGGVQSDMKR